MNHKITEHKSSSYAPRTYHNASSADLTLALAIDFNTAGEKLTHKAAGDKYLAISWNTDYIIAARGVYKAMKKRNASSLNIAGNGIYTWQKYGVNQHDINVYLYSVLSLVHKHLPIQKIVSGGQTGVDLAGGVVAEVLGVESVMTLPKGFKQRFADGKDIEQGEQSVHSQEGSWVELLRKTYVR